jgi:hypothetical protein
MKKRLLAVRIGITYMGGTMKVTACSCKQDTHTHDHCGLESERWSTINFTVWSHILSTGGDALLSTEYILTSLNLQVLSQSFKKHALLKS